MQLARLERFEDEQIEGALEEIGLAGAHTLRPIGLLYVCCASVLSDVNRRE
jgi:hypothetical protein